ncbi:MAG: O-antigen ligase family protein [Tepidisphaeraceae bacterium]|jgi:hypothetical protein
MRLLESIELRVAAIALAFVLAAIFMSYAMADSLLPVAGAAYVLIFWTVAWYRPDFAMFVIFVSAPFQNDLGDNSGPRISIAEMHLALALPVFILKELIQKRPLRIGPVGIAIFFYLTVCMLSNILNWYADPSDQMPLIGFLNLSTSNKNITGIQAFAQMVLYMVAAPVLFCTFCRDISKLLKCFYALVVVGVILSLTAIVVRSNYFLGLNKNGLGGSLATAAVISLELWLAAKRRKTRWALGAATVVILAGDLMSMSRGAWLATIVGVVVIMSVRRQFKRLLLMLLLVIPVITLWWYFLTPLQRDYVTAFDASHENIKIRFDSIAFAIRLFRLHPVYGFGVFLRKQYDATNIILCVLAETGVLGLATFLGIFAVLAAMFWKTIKIIKPADPLFSFVSIAAALTFARLVHGVADHYWSRGPILNAWASVGMATAVYFISQRRKRAAHRLCLAEQGLIRNTANTPWNAMET